MNDEIKKLEQAIEQNEKEKQRIENKLNRLENRKEYYQKGERAKRTHRLCTIGGTVESVAPEVRELGQHELYNLMEYIFSLPEARAALDRITERGG